MLLGGPCTGAAWCRVRANAPSSAAGEHANGPVGWDKRFLIDVTGQLEPGKENVIVVRVYNSIGAGGIWKPVRLIAQSSNNSHP